MPNTFIYKMIKFEGKKRNVFFVQILVCMVHVVNYTV